MRKIVTLCGSYKFKSSFEECKEILENDDCMVLMPDTFTSSLSLNDATNEQLERIHSIHEHKMLLSDYVLFINKDGYMGEDTLRELKFCLNNKIPVEFLEPCCTRDMVIHDLEKYKFNTTNVSIHDLENDIFHTMSTQQSIMDELVNVNAKIKKVETRLNEVEAKLKAKLEDDIRKSLLCAPPMFEGKPKKCKSKKGKSKGPHVMPFPFDPPINNDSIFGPPMKEH